MNRIITIGREFGSGGREFGRRLAEELHIEYYDREIITEVAKRTKLTEEYIHMVTEQRPHALFPITVGRSINLMADQSFYMVQSVYAEQSRILRELAEKSDCVVVGRCADYILRDWEPFRVFVYAEMESRIRRCQERSTAEEKLSDKDMRRSIQDVDRSRAKYYSFYTGQKWGDKEYYDPVHKHHKPGYQGAGRVVCASDALNGAAGRKGGGP